MALFHGNRKWVFPLKIPGRFTRWHKGTSAALFAFLAVVPWLRWGDNPLFLADVPGRRVHLLGQLFTASDGVLIMLLALIAAFALFFFTTIFGRLWCGYFCPQSVFMINLVYPIEEWIEGPRAQRIARSQGPATFDVWWRRIAKWTVFLVFSVVISLSFMGFFVPAELLWTGAASGTSYAVVAFFTAIWFFDMAWYREQTCNYICPYARFQSALIDDESLVISYDVPRGEPRGKAARERGGCIDCNKCVVVCPQGIDIRDGFQLECIACGRCVDACESVMGKLGHPTLVRYSTFAKDAGQPSRGFHRGRMLAYGGLLGVLVAAGVGVMVTRDAIEVLVDRAPGALFVEDADGFVRNTWMVHLVDRVGEPGRRAYAVAVEGLPDGSEARALPVQLTSGERGSVPLVVRVPRASAARTLPLTVRIRGVDHEVEIPATFKGPGEEE